jgi:AcrR family transcriptional regulator
MAKSDTKERLIEAAMDLFSTKGYDGTSVDEIAESIGIKGPTIYKYFKGKEALLETLINQADEAYNKGFQVGVELSHTVQNGADFKEYVINSIMYTFNNETIRKMRKLFTIEQYRNQTFTDNATSHQITNVRELYSRLFKRLIDAGVMVNGNPDIFALEFTALNTVMIQLYDREPDRKEEILQIIKEHTDTFVERYFLS